MCLRRVVCVLGESVQMNNTNPQQGVLCPTCKKRMFSYHVYDYKECGCENETMVDGGKEYLRYGWKSIKPELIDFDPEKDKPNVRKNEQE